MLTFLLTALPADLKLASLFTDHMVFQRQTNCPIWGWANPGQKVTIKASWGANTTATADKNGAWKTSLKTPAAGGPFTLNVGNIQLKDVLVGEVWLCSGQSNMEMWLKAYASPAPVVNWEKELETANQLPNVRLFQVPRLMSAKPEAIVNAVWQNSSSEAAGMFSAVGFMFARELNRKLNIPIGIIHSSWGGTEVELWTSEPGMRKLPELGVKLDAYRKNAITNVARQAEYQAELKKFVPTEKPEWATAAFEPDSTWKSVAKVGSFNAIGLGDFDGSVWYRTEIEVPANLAGQDARLKLGTIDDDERTYFNGKMVGETEGWDVQRNYSITLKAGKNLVVVRATDGAGAGGFAGDQLIEVGDQKLPLTNWRYLPIVNPNRPPQPNYLPSSGFSTLYNGMIAPLAPFAIKGALWYQGESNVSRAEQYQRSFPNMIQDWRTAWGTNFSFYFVQIAPFAYQPPYGPELREAQGFALKMKNTGMVLTTDLVDSLTNIHPIKKRQVADRLAALALLNDYGQKVTANGPTFKSATPSGRSMRVIFTNASGLKGTGEGFQVAGKDGVYCDATARIEGDAVVVESVQVSNPVSLRYGWSDTMLATLWNGAGLPMVPFRTDNLPLFTKGVRW